MKLDEYLARFPDQRKPVPPEFSGLWISWNEDLTEIMSSGTDAIRVRDQAFARGCPRPVLQKLFPGPFVGV